MKPIKLPSKTKKKMQKTNRKNPNTRLAGGGAHHASHELVGHLRHGLQAARHAWAATRAHRDQKAGECHRQQHEETRIGQGDVMAPDQNREDGMQGKLVDRIDRRSRLCRHVLWSSSSSASLRGLKRPPSGSAPPNEASRSACEAERRTSLSGEFARDKGELRFKETVLAKSAGSRSRSPRQRRSRKIQSETQDWCGASGRAPSQSPSR